MPRGRPKGSKNKVASAVKKPAYVPTGRKRGRPSRAEMAARMAANGAPTQTTATAVTKPVHGASISQTHVPLETKEVAPRAPEMDVAAFLEVTEQIKKLLTKGANITNHVREGEFFKNLVICIERQIEPKYKNPAAYD